MIESMGAAPNRLALTLAALGLTIAGCESAPLERQTDADGAATVVHLLDAHFVRVAGERVPWQELVYDMRVLCRDRRRTGSPAPWVEFRVPGGASAVPRASVDRLQAGLREAGVRRIEMTIEDS